MRQGLDAESLEWWMGLNEVLYSLWKQFLEGDLVPLTENDHMASWENHLIF